MIDTLINKLLKARAGGLLLPVTVVIVVACLCGMSACGSDESVAAVHEQGQTTSQIVREYAVLLVPNLQGGIAGWCLTVVQEGARGCAAPSTLRGGIFTEGCAPHDPASTEVYALTRSNVMKVSVHGGPPIATRTTPSLIGGLRSVVVEEADGGVCPSVTPLDIRGKPMLRPRRLMGPPLEVVLRGRRQWRRPTPPAQGLCALKTAHLRGYVARWGNVVTRMSASRVFDGGFVSCVDSEYFSPEEASMDAAVLLNAAQPGGTPKPLPGMRALRGRLDVFEAPGSEGELVARRIPHAWLVVEEGGTGIGEALTLLEHLHATVDRV
jgi:hypothetical protein